MSTNSISLNKILLSSASLIISLSFALIDAKPSMANSTPCKKSAPEPYSFVGILAFSIAGGGCLLKQRLRKKDSSQDNNNLQPINELSICNNHQENVSSFYPSFELHVIDPTKVN